MVFISQINKYITLRNVPVFDNITDEGEKMIGSCSKSGNTHYDKDNSNLPYNTTVSLGLRVRMGNKVDCNLGEKSETVGWEPVDTFP